MISCGVVPAVMPFLDERSEALRSSIHDNYEPGSWGPPAAEELLARYGAHWHEIKAVPDPPSAV